MAIVWILRLIGVGIVMAAVVGVVYVLVYDTLGRWFR